ncbi:MAG: hypothetical protein CMO79_03095 [Verrucomicrobiales bacterium]|nr:hypothetical protein [Verrucomicrobiales bacterium]
MLQQVILHGLLAAALLICGWLFPVKYKALHPKVLEQAGLAAFDKKDTDAQKDDDKLKKFIDSQYSSKGDEPIRTLLEFGDGQVKGEKPSLKNFNNALSIFVDPTRRKQYMEILAEFNKSEQNGFNKPDQNLYRLKQLAPQYRSAAALAAYLDGRRKLHSNLREDLLISLNNNQTNRVERTLHAFITLGTRLNFEQMGEITSHTPSAEGLVNFAKIAKIQTILYPFNSYDENLDGSISFEELEAIESRLTEEEGLFAKIAGSDRLISREEWIELGFIPLGLTKFPTIYTASVWSKDPEGVANYLMLYGRGGEEWLTQAMNEPARSSGNGALKALLNQQLPLTRGGLTLPGVASFSYQHPAWALLVKYILIGLGCLVIIRAWNSYFVLKAVDTKSLQSLRLRRKSMAFALLILLVGISEPSLLQSAYSSEYQIAINVPQLSPTEPIEPSNNTNVMLAEISPIIVNALIIAVFAAIQIAVFTTCTNKIREIMSGEGDNRLKLQLLENEDNLFDMGLYIGIAGTALTLAAKLLMETDAINLSAAYASNIFGILCVAMVKIKHLRPSRESLIRDDVVS